MIKKNWKILVVTSIVILLPMLAGAILWQKLPDEIPTHWNALGEVDGYVSKGLFVFGFPPMMLAFQWLCVLVTSLDPKGKNHQPKMLQVVFWAIPAINLFLSVLTYTTALGVSVQISVAMPLFLGFLFLIIGNYLPKCKQNYTIGIKIAWTLHSEENWNRTHRFAGWVWTVGSLVIMATSIFGSFWIFIALVLAMVVAPIAYSFILYKKGI